MNTKGPYETQMHHRSTEPEHRFSMILRRTPVPTDSAHARPRGQLQRSRHYCRHHSRRRRRRRPRRPHGFVCLHRQATAAVRAGRAAAPRLGQRVHPHLAAAAAPLVPTAAAAWAARNLCQSSLGRGPAAAAMLRQSAWHRHRRAAPTHLNHARNKALKEGARELQARVVVHLY